MKKIKLTFLLVALSISLIFAIYGAYHRYSNLKNTMEIQDSIFQFVELKSANAEWDIELNRVHSDNLPHFDLVNSAAVKYENEMAVFIKATTNLQKSIQVSTANLVALSSQKKQSMNDYLSEIAVTRNSLKFLDTLLFSLHSKYDNDKNMLKFFSHTEHRLSVIIASNQNIHLKAQKKPNECKYCSLEQNKAIFKVNQHLSFLKKQVSLSHKARDAFYNPKHEALLTSIFNELSSTYVKADMMYQTIQAKVIMFAAILVVIIVILLILLYWLYRTIEGHRTIGITDPLTGLYNRKKLFENLTYLIPSHKKSNKKLALLFIDLDGFKNINDTYGHDIGDKLLQLLSERLISSVRKQDFTYRIGGDEFVVLIQELSRLEDAESIAESILTKCNKPYLLEKNNCHVTLSIGISLFPDHSEDPNELLKYADEGMYDSKRNGKSIVTTWCDNSI
jgi:diguanylate cyclase (GGDEF)-like protein